MLVTEAINLEKSWDDIKDLLRLKLCNTNIHTYTSCFMDIQQWENESLAAYVHRFKTEAKQCNLTNDTATIRIFFKGLRNGHSLATRIYKKDPHTLQDTQGSKENWCSTTTHHCNHPSFNSKHDVKQGKSVFPMPGVRPYHTTLPTCLMLWMWWIWTHPHGLPSWNITFQDTRTTP